MKLHEFENLWAQRETLEPEERKSLEQFAKSDKHARAFVEGGFRVRDVLSGLEGEKAAGDFAWKMRVYAANHKDESERAGAENGGWLRWLTIPTGPQAGTLRWSAVSAGLVAGAMLVLIAFGPMFTSPTGVVAPGGTAESVEQPAESVDQAASQDALPVSGDLASITDSSEVEEADTIGGPVERSDVPEWDLRAVSTGN